MKKRMYEVINHFKSENDLNHFLETTKNFSKRFYNVDTETRKDPNNNPHPILRVTAIAISRDLTYILKMDIRCHEKLPAELLAYDNFAVPAFALYPTEEGVKELYYPDAERGIYQNIFEKDGFQQVGSIHNDDKNILK